MVTRQPMSLPPLAAAPRQAWLAAACLLTVTTVASYWNSFDVPFLFDDQKAIIDNPSIRPSASVTAVLSPPQTSTTGGRPLLNLSFALNYAWTRRQPWSYHLVNLVVHTLAGITLFGLVRRTLQLPPGSTDFSRAAWPLATVIALTWLLHPLQTASVTYISQRAESLAGLFFLLTLYCFVRARSSPMPDRWAALSIGACCGGVATKEIVVTAPVCVLLYDRAFLAESFRGALAARPRYYLGLGSSWLLLAGLIVHSNLSARSVGFDQGVSAWQYACTQAEVIVRYAALMTWPQVLVFDYGPEMLAPSLAAVAPYALGTLAGLGVACWLWRRSKRLGLLAVAFFVLLAPTSSVMPVALQPMAENRLYLPLASIVSITVLVLYRVAGMRALLASVLMVPPLATLTANRNRDFGGELRIWTDTVEKRPHNSRAHNNLAIILAKVPGRLTEALAHYAEAIRIKPDYADAHNNLATELATLPGRLPEALEHYSLALRYKPDLPEAHYNLANELAKMPGRLSDALAHYRQAIQFKPDYATAHNNLANELAKLPGSLPDALAHYEQALRIEPDYFEAHNNYAAALATLPDRRADALGHYEQALRLKPDYAAAHNNRGTILAQIPGRLPEAIDHYARAIRLQPGFAEAHFNLANELARLPGRQTEAIAHYEQALRHQPGFAEAHNNLANELARLPSRLPDALTHYEAALRLKPDYIEAHNNLANVLVKLPGRLHDALAHYTQALRIRPDSFEAHCNLAQALSTTPERLPEAMIHYEQALRLNPASAEAHNGLAVALASVGRLDDAIRHLERALQLNPAFEQARANLEKCRAAQLR